MFAKVKPTAGLPTVKDDTTWRDWGERLLGFKFPTEMAAQQAVTDYHRNSLMSQQGLNAAHQNALQHAIANAAPYQFDPAQQHKLAQFVSQYPQVPPIKRPETEPHNHVTTRPELQQAGQSLINALDKALPLKLRLPIETYQFRTTRHNETGMFSNPRIAVKFRDGKEIEFPIDDETTWPTEDVIGRIALEMP